MAVSTNPFDDVVCYCDEDRTLWFFAVFSLLENTLWGCLRRLIVGLDLMVIVIARVQRVKITNLNKTYNYTFDGGERKRLFEREVFLPVSKKDL